VVLQPDPTGSADDQLSYTTTGGTIVRQMAKLKQAVKDTGAESTEMVFTQIAWTVARSESHPSKTSGRGRSH
jgi:hypothetical protein